MTIDQLIDSFDENKIYKYADISVKMISLLSEFDEIEKIVLSIINQPTPTEIKSKYRVMLWDRIMDCGLEDKKNIGRARIFFGALSKNELIDSYSGGMLITFAQFSGISDKEILSLFDF
jgi:hypothetical protein